MNCLKLMPHISEEGRMWLTEYFGPSWPLMDLARVEKELEVESKGWTTLYPAAFLAHYWLVKAINRS